LNVYISSLLPFSLASWSGKWRMADVVDSVVGESPLLISRLFGLLFWVLIGLNFILLAFARY
jgi:hypothetical protein